MTALVKAEAAPARIRPLRTPAPLPIALPELSATEMALAAATATIARLEAEVAAMREDTASAITAARLKGEAEGRLAGIAAAEQDWAERTAAILGAAAAARAAWDDRLGELDALAVMLARAALGRIFTPAADLADLTARAIAAQVKALRADSIVVVRVSARDLATPEVVAALADAVEAASGSAVDIVADAALPGGECRIDLRLGHVDIGVGTQWRALDRFLADLAADAAA